MHIIACPSCGAPQPDARPGRAFHCAFCKTRIEPDPAAFGAQGGQYRVGGPVRETGGARAIVAGVAVLVCIVAAGAMFWSVKRTGPVAIEPTAIPPSVPAPLPIATVIASSATAAADAAPPEVAAVADVETNPVTLIWHGHVRAATGDRPIAAGTACTLTEVVVHGSKPNTVESTLLTFQCGGKMLYDSSIPLEGMANMSSSFEEVEVAGELNAFQYETTHQDVGTRAGNRNQITLSTHDGFVEAFRDIPPDFHVKAIVDKLTAIRRGKPITDANIPSFSDVVRRVAKVTSRSGAVPFAGSTCDLAISPAGAGTKDNCRVVLTCGGKVVFGKGTGGFEKCTMQNGEPESLVDPYPTPKDTDPELTVDLEAGTATLGDTLPNGGQYTVGFTLTSK